MKTRNATKTNAKPAAVDAVHLLQSRVDKQQR